MLALKRKRAGGSGEHTDISLFPDQAFSDDEIDISSALAGKKPKIAPATEDSDDDLRDFLHETISRRDVKTGTDVVKKAKGKGKIAKGEVGGGSFQSMGQAVIFNAVLHNEILNHNDRSSSFAPAVFDTSGISDSDSNTASLYPGASYKPSSRPCWHGSYRIR